MKKIILILFIVLICCNWTSNAQNLIAVQNNSTPSFFTSLDSAIIHSQNGDTIYLPGGNFSLTTTIDKCLHIIGVGHNPDSAIGCGRTIITGNLNLSQDASGGSLWGISLTGNGNIQVIAANTMISNYTIKRCNFVSVGINGYCSSWIVIENVFYGMSSSSNGASNFIILNNFIQGTVCSGQYGISNSIIKNNIFTGLANFSYGSGCWPLHATYSTIENNIFTSNGNQHSLALCSFCFVYNNLFVETLQSPLPSQYSNNIDGQNQSSIFIYLTATAYYYTDDYHLQPTCPGKNAGTDGTDIGIYGGAFPWKEGSIPFNPHIQYKTISGATDVNGNLNVNIKVAAQDH